MHWCFSASLERFLMRFERSAKRDCVFSLRSVGVVHIHTGATLKHIGMIQNAMLHVSRVGYMYIGRLHIMFCHIKRLGRTRCRINGMLTKRTDGDTALFNRSSRLRPLIPPFRIMDHFSCIASQWFPFSRSFVQPLVLGKSPSAIT